MPKTNTALLAFNRGIVSRYALARVDLERLRLSAAVQTNWLPRTLGPMSLRPGLGYVGTSKNNQEAEFLTFVRSMDDIATIELTNEIARFWIADALLTRLAVSTTITNGDFSSGTGWTLATSGGATASISSGVLTMAAPARGGKATATRTFTVSGGDQSVEHGIRIIVNRGPVILRMGSTSGDDDIVSRQSLGQGTHSFAVTPGIATVYVQFETTSRISCIVDSILIEAAGVMELPSPWATANLDRIRFTQSADVMFVACAGVQQRRIERRGPRSWSIVLYKPNDGPFRPATTIAGLTLTPSDTMGNITLAASQPLFKQSHIGSLFRLYSSQQSITETLSAADTYSDPIRVAGVAAARRFEYQISGAWVGKVTLQRSFDSETAGFADTAINHTANAGPTGFNDTLDNSIVWYRMGFKPGDYTSGSADISLNYQSGGGVGIVRITDVASTTSASAEVLHTLKSTVATEDWREGEWSARLGYPSATTIHDGRLWWFGNDKEWGSISDDYESFDAEFLGEAGPISRSIGYGPVETINWALSLQRMIVGTAASEISVRSSSFDEPLTPTNFTQKDCSTQGSAAMAAVKMDGRGIYVQRSRQRLMKLEYSVERNDYHSVDLNQICPDLLGTGEFVKIAIQRQPDTRIHGVRADGKVSVLVYEPDQGVVCWVTFETDGFVETAFVLPGLIEDEVYYLVRRTIGVSTFRYIEKFALDYRCWGLPEARLADSYKMFTSVTATTTITGLAHLEGKTVVVWGWNTITPFTNHDGTAVGRDLGTYTVVGGQITVSTAVTDACVGLYYEAPFKSAKLAYSAAMGTALAQRKKVNSLGVVMSRTHYQGLRYGKDFDSLDSLPEVENEQTTPAHTIWDEFDSMAFTFPGEWDTDSRLCLQAASPRPCTLLAAVLTVETTDKA